MNLDIIFKTLFVTEILLIAAVTILRFKAIRHSWKTSLFGYLGIVVTLGIQGMYFIRTGQLYELVNAVQFLAFGIALLITDDYRDASPN